MKIVKSHHLGPNIGTDQDPCTSKSPTTRQMPGFLSVDELEAGQLMTWSNLDAAKRARKVFGIPSLEEFVELHDTDGE